MGRGDLGEVSCPHGLMEAGRDVLGKEFWGAAGETAVGFFVEAGGDGFDGAGEEGIELDVEFVEGEAGFHCKQLGKHERAELNGLIGLIELNG